MSCCTVPSNHSYLHNLTSDWPLRNDASGRPFAVTQPQSGAATHTGPILVCPMVPPCSIAGKAPCAPRPSAIGSPLPGSHSSNSQRLAGAIPS